MKMFQHKQYVSTLTQGILKSAVLLVLVSCLAVMSSCSDSDDTYAPYVLEGKIVSYNEFGAAMLSFTSADMEKAGFTLGDVITITVKGQDIEMPYYDGFYALNGVYLCVAYPTYPSVCFTANNIGLPAELRGLEGQRVVVRMKEKGGMADVQEALSMEYGFDRKEYSSDEVFANAREVNAGNIAPGVLHRTSSPFSDEICRSIYVSQYLDQNQVKTVLNLADTEEKMTSYYDAMPPYSRKLWDNEDVILCPLKADPMADDFIDHVVAALKELPSRPAPYGVHCVEGKDRTGYVCALLEGLCGATYEEIITDYLKTYENYYYIDRENDNVLCYVLLEIRLHPCLMFYAGVTESELPDVDYAEAFANFLLKHGMTQEEIDNLVSALTTPQVNSNMNFK